MKNRFDEDAKNWDTPERIARAKRNADFLIQRYNITQELNLFELGTGTGILSLLLSEYAKKITVTDNSEEMLKVLTGKLQAANVPNIIPLRFDIEGEQTLNEKYDLIISTMVLHHLSDIYVVASKIYSLTKDGGKIAIIDLMKENGDFHHDNTGVNHFGFTEAELYEYFSKAMFKNLSVEKVDIIRKSTKGGELKEFPIFMLYGEK